MVSVSTISLVTVSSLLGVDNLGLLFVDGFQRGIIAEVLTGLRRGRGEWEADVPEAVAQRIIEGRLLGFDTE